VLSIKFRCGAGCIRRIAEAQEDFVWANQDFFEFEDEQLAGCGALKYFEPVQAPFSSLWGTETANARISEDRVSDDTAIRFAGITKAARTRHLRPQSPLIHFYAANAVRAPLCSILI